MMLGEGIVPPPQEFQMEYLELKQKAEDALRGMSLNDMEQFRRRINFEVSVNRKIWRDIEKADRQSHGYFSFQETIDYKDPEQLKELRNRLNNAAKATSEAAQKIVREFTLAACQGVLSGGRAKWWWSSLDDPQHEYKPTEISDEAKQLTSLMMSHSFWWPLKGRYLNYGDVRDFVAAVLLSVEAEDIALRDDRDVCEMVNAGVTSASIYAQFLKFYDLRESVEKDYIDGFHCGDCTSVPASCTRCIIDDARNSAEEFMQEMGWI